MPSAVLILNLGAPFRIRAGADIETAEYADGRVVTRPTRAFEFGYPPGTRSVKHRDTESSSISRVNAESDR